MSDDRARRRSLEIDALTSPFLVEFIKALEEKDQLSAGVLSFLSSATDILYDEIGKALARDAKARAFSSFTTKKKGSKSRTPLTEANLSTLGLVVLGQLEGVLTAHWRKDFESSCDAIIASLPPTLARRAEELEVFSEVKDDVSLPTLVKMHTEVRRLGMDERLGALRSQVMTKIDGFEEYLGAVRECYEKFQNEPKIPTWIKHKSDFSVVKVTEFLVACAEEVRLAFEGIRDFFEQLCASSGDIMQSAFSVLSHLLFDVGGELDRCGVAARELEWLLAGDLLNTGEAEQHDQNSTPAPLTPPQSLAHPSNGGVSIVVRIRPKVEYEMKQRVVLEADDSMD